MTCHIYNVKNDFKLISFHKRSNCAPLYTNGIKCNQLFQQNTTMAMVINQLHNFQQNKQGCLGKFFENHQDPIKAICLTHKKKEPMPNQISLLILLDYYCIPLTYKSLTNLIGKCNKQRHWPVTFQIIDQPAKHYSRPASVNETC